MPSNWEGFTVPLHEGSARTSELPTPKQEQTLQSVKQHCWALPFKWLVCASDDRCSLISFQRFRVSCVSEAKFSKAALIHASYPGNKNAHGLDGARQTRARACLHDTCIQGRRTGRRAGRFPRSSGAARRAASGEGTCRDRAELFFWNLAKLCRSRCSGETPCPVALFCSGLLALADVVVPAALSW